MDLYITIITIPVVDVTNRYLISHVTMMLYAAHATTNYTDFPRITYEHVA